MTRSRLNTALSEGFLSVPTEGRIAVVRPPAGHDLAEMPPERTVIVQGFRPDADYWAAMGFDVEQQLPGDADLVIVVVPRSKRLARALVAEAAGSGRYVVVDGQKSDGVDGLFREVRRRAGDLGSLTQAHGRLFGFTADQVDLSDWRIAGPARGKDGFFTRPGVFSEDGVDRGSNLLGRRLPVRLGPRVADLGAGWGYLSALALGHDGVESVDLIEAEAAALDCARLNVTDDRARFHWADAREFSADASYDTVLCNPPFHTARKADTALGEAFIDAAASLLSPQGSLWLVANRHLPYEVSLRGAFASVEEVGSDPAFKIFHAARPRRSRSSRR